MSPVLPERDSLPFSELLAALQRDRCSCTVRVTDGLFDGELRLEDGELHTAAFAGLEGRAALDAMLIADEVRCSVVDELELHVQDRPRGSSAPPQDAPAAQPTIDLSAQPSPALGLSAWPAGGTAGSVPPPLPSAARTSRPPAEEPPAVAAVHRQAAAPEFQSEALVAEYSFAGRNAHPGSVTMRGLAPLIRVPRHGASAGHLHDGETLSGVTPPVIAQASDPRPTELQSWAQRVTA
jgi:hypothetical protein